MNKEIQTSYYNQLNTEELLNLVIDFINIGQVIPEVVKDRLDKLGLLHILCTAGDTDEESNYVYN